MKIGPMISMLGFPNRVVWLSLLLILSVVASSASRIAYAGYADGTGTGQYQNQIYWLDWAGFSFTNGSSKIFNLPGDVTVIATVSNISGVGAVSIGRPEDYQPAAFNLAYPNTGQTAIKSCNACTNRFRLTLSANVAGTAVPVDMVVADAEAAAANEALKVTTNGKPWQLLEQFQAANLRATWSNNDETLELHGNGSTTYGTVLAVSTDVINFDFEIVGGGVSAAALGVFLPSDYGDAPTSFGDAGHYIRQTFTGGLPGAATKVYDPVSTAFTSFATISDAPTVFLGPLKPDADPGTQNAAPNATNALGDNLDNTNDEDGVASFPPLTQASASYSVSATAHNTSGNQATLWGWIDFNGDDQFSAAEAASIPVADGANPASVTLNWPTVTVTPAIGSTVYARLRLTTGILTGNGATGGAADGEVEDYALRILGDFGDAPNDLSSIDAALGPGNAYPTLLSNNGPRHTPVNGIHLGILIDTENDGQPNLEAKGDDINGQADEDGVAFNPALIITTANVVLSGVQNTLVVTASASGYLSVWIDYNQNGTFTDAGEQLFNDQAVTAGPNALTFTTPNTAPHGATYMRFRYSTQTGVANTVTGSAPDGEVEDYRVEVALPAPQTCDADLVNGSFETPGAGLLQSSQVPGWGFRATEPASGAGFDERHVIEIWPNNQEGVPAYEGSQFAEINGYVAGALYQEMITVPGQTMLWQFAHRGRQGPDVMALKIGPPGATVEVMRATDDISAWNLYNGSYTVPAGQTITRFEFAAISSTGGDPSIGNFIDAVHFSLPCDFGDAPDTYHTSKLANGANHLIATTLRLGAIATDAEGSGFPGVNADGDNLNNTNDEDSLTALPPLNQANTAYTLSAIPVFNNSGSATTLYGWIDFNRNGQFDAGERTSVSVPTSATAQSITLTWSGLSGLVAGQSYLRLRLSNQSGLSATDIGGAGEVEDYPLTITTAGTLVVVKNTTGGDGSFSFSSPGLTPTPFTLTTAGGTAQRTFTNLLPGTYSVSETVPTGWDLTSATCSNGSNPASINLAAGENVTCTFANTRRGAIIVVKRAVGEDRAFSFVSSSLGNFDLTTVNGEVQHTFSNLSPGIHDVSETVPRDWELSGGDPICSDGSRASSINLSAGETVLCVFINLQDDTIVVEVRTTGGDGAFPFTSQTLTPSFSLTTSSGAAQRAFTNLQRGTYDVSETVPAGWRLTSATCDNNDSPDQIILAAPDQTVRCTFVYQSTIVANIPTLSEWGLLLLGALLGFNLWQRGPGRLARRR